MKKIMIAIMSLCLLAVWLKADDMENEASEAKYYDNAKVVRIKNIEGEGFVQRSYEEGFEEATPNLPLFEKDTVGTTAGRLGIYLGRLNYLRLDADTTVQLLSIPQLRKTDFIARVEKGAICLDVQSLDSEKSIEIQTPDCGIFILDKGIYRINVDENSLTEVYVMEGIAEVAGQESSRNVRENQKIVMARGEVKERPYYFYASEKDAFDRWNETQNREQGYARIGTSRYLQSGYEDYEYEMSRSGRWSYMSDFNSYVWTPYYSNADWRPYANGRWVWNPHYGYVWTSYDTCGWFTHHYGRWHWSYAGGWYWIPGYHWSPAWVSWFGDDNYYGWCPLSWWNRPVIVINNRWDRNYNYRHGMPHHGRSTIIIRKHEIAAPNIRRLTINRNGSGPTGAKLIAYQGAAPSERLASAKVTVINANGKAVAYRQNGIVSAEKYKISNDASTGNTGGAVKSPVYKYNNSNDANGNYSRRISRGKDNETAVENSGKNYSPRSYQARDAEKSTGTGSSGYFRSRSSSESSTGSSGRSASSSSGGDKSPAKAKASGNSGSSAKSSSSTSGSAKATKKKKDEAAYMALLQSENSSGFKSHALGLASAQSGYSSRSDSTDNGSYSGYESNSYSAARSSGAYAPASSSRLLVGSGLSGASTESPPIRYSSRSGSSSYRQQDTGGTSYRNFSTISPGYHSNSSSNGYNGSRSYSQGVGSSSSYRSDSSRSYANGSGSSSAYSSGNSSRAISSAPAHQSGHVTASAPHQSSRTSSTSSGSEKKKR